LSRPAPAGFLDAVRALREALEQFGAPWLVIGGVAVIAHGVPRATVDVDATVWAAERAVEDLFAACARLGITPRIDGALQFAKGRHVLLLTHDASGVPVDVTIAWLPFEQDAIAHGELVDWAGVPLRVPRVADLVIYKLVAARPRDLDDAEQLLTLHGRDIDVDRITRLVGEFAAALDDPGRIETLERLLRRAGVPRH
jgi:hypothetical protein